eukprot:2468688-Rhodomonas_salina.3
MASGADAITHTPSVWCWIAARMSQWVVTGCCVEDAVSRDAWHAQWRVLRGRYAMPSGGWREEGAKERGEGAKERGERSSRERRKKAERREGARSEDSAHA